MSVLTDDEIESLAQEHVKKTYPPDCEIVHTERWLDPDGIYFVANIPTHDEATARYLRVSGLAGLAPASSAESRRKLATAAL